MNTSHYIHGTADEEQRRLRLMNRILNEASLRELDAKRGDRIVEFGSGLGEFARAMAALTGVRVVGIERDHDQIDKCMRLAREGGEEGLLDIRQGDVFAPPLAEEERGSFDIAHARFLLEHLSDPLAAVRQMVASVREGGRIVVEDDDHDLLRLWPEPPRVMQLWRAYIRSYERIGNDPFIGRRLVELLHRAGATPCRNRQLFFGSCAGSETFDAIVDNTRDILAGAADVVVELDLIDAASVRAALEELAQWRTRPDAAFWYTMSWAEGRRPKAEGSGERVEDEAERSKTRKQQ